MSSLRPDPYWNPALYDLEYTEYREDIPWYTALAQSARGPVLELGCGSGRITVPLAEAGAEVTGLERSVPMLTALRERLLSEPEAVADRVRLVRGSFLDIPFRHEFSAIFLPFNAIHHCADHREVLRLFAEVRKALQPGGFFALDCYTPDPLLYQRDPERRYGIRVDYDPRDGRIIDSWEQSHYDPVAQVHHVIYTYQYQDGEQVRLELDLRMYYPAELLGLIDLAGFEIVQRAGDFEGNPATPQSERWVMVLKPR